MVIDFILDILGGFSQGGSLALFSGLTYPKPLGGLLLLSCLMRLCDIIPKVGGAGSMVV